MLWCFSTNYMEEIHAWWFTWNALISALHQELEDNLNKGLADHNPRTCIVCNPDMASANSDLENCDEFAKVGWLGSIEK